MTRAFAASAPEVAARASGAVPAGARSTRDSAPALPRPAPGSPGAPTPNDSDPQSIAIQAAGTGVTEHQGA